MQRRKYILRAWLGICLALALAVSAQVFAANGNAQSSAKSMAQARADLIDINTATVAQLQAIPGMGEEYAKRIIAGRPYYAKNQLVHRGILPQDVYDKIKDKIIAHHIKKR
ncbi:MAG: ComEA family DNA-binding protein [Acidobacteriaceae bacterium]